MNELVNKLTSYNIFNYLLPGTIFSLLVSKWTTYELLQQDLFVGFFVYYFIGLLISRTGSLIIEPLLKRLRVIEFVPYVQYMRAADVDKKIEMLSEQNNIYRTLVAMFLCFYIVYGYSKLQDNYEAIYTLLGWLFAPALVVLLVVAYRKQTQYVAKRAQHHGSDG